MTNRSDTPAGTPPCASLDASPGGSPQASAAKWRRMSLQYRLSAWISLAVIVVAGSAAAFTFRASWNDAHLAQDKQLRQTAHLIGRLQTGPVTLAARKKISGIARDERIIVRFLPAPGIEAAPDPQGGPLFPAHLRDGVQSVEIGDDAWRVFVRTDDGGVRVAVAQQTKVRDAVAVDSALRSLIPFALLALLLPLLVHFLIGKLFRPLRALAEQSAQRDTSDVRPLDAAGLPDEVLPLVAEINRLLQRVDRAMQAQRRFVADAAHELRSPLTALSLQTERLAAADMPDEARRRMVALAQGLERTRVMLDQLLALARSTQVSQGAQGAQGRLAGVSLQHATRAVIEELYPLAEQRDIDLGVLSSGDATVRVAPLDLHMLMKNLIDNAIRYTPRGGRVDVSFGTRDGALARARTVVVEFIVDDTGLGIAEAERERVFQAFYRTPGNGAAGGSGLGLAIVKAVADKSGATVTLAASQTSASGLRVVVAFPA